MNNHQLNLLAKQNVAVLDMLLIGLLLQMLVKAREYGLHNYASLMIFIVMMMFFVIISILQ